MNTIERRELAEKFIEECMEEQQIVDLYNQHAEDNYYAQIYPMDEGTIDDLVGTEGRTALEIRDSFDSDFSTGDNWMIVDDRYGTLTSFNDIEDYVTYSELVDTFFVSEWCSCSNDEFKDYVISELKDNEYPEKFIQWFDNKCDSSTEWNDTDDLIEMWGEQIVEKIEFDMDMEDGSIEHVVWENEDEDEDYSCDYVNQEDGPWFMVEVRGEMYDFQISGNDDEEPQICQELKINANVMRKVDDENYEHSDYWVDMDSFSNINVTYRED